MRSLEDGPVAADAHARSPAAACTRAHAREHARRRPRTAPDAAMAEARSAVNVPTFQLTVSQDGVLLRIDRDAVRYVLRSARRSVVRKLFEVRNRFLYGLWPATPSQVALAAGSIAACMFAPERFRNPVSDMLWTLESKIPWPKRIGTSRLWRGVCFSAGAATAASYCLAYVRRYTLRMLLQYHGWLRDDPKRVSIVTQVWAFGVHVVRGFGEQLLYSYQKSLPRQPVPPLRSTVERYLDSMQPLLGDDELAERRRMAEEFLRNEGPRIQRYLVLKSWFTDNYVSDWWEQYVYLAGRVPLMINSNYYVCDAVKQYSTTVQVARAANLLTHIMNFKRMVRRARRSRHRALCVATDADADRSTAKRCSRCSCATLCPCACTSIAGCSRRRASPYAGTRPRRAARGARHTRTRARTRVRLTWLRHR